METLFKDIRYGVRGSNAVEEPGIHPRCGAVACPRHWRQHSGLQHRQLVSVCTVAGRRAEPPCFYLHLGREEPGPAAEVERSADRWREMVDSGKRRVVGLNCYQADEEPEASIFRVDPEIERVAVERIRGLRAGRDEERWADAMRQYQQAAAHFAQKDVSGLGDDELMLAAIEAARANATTGEMMNVLKKALGWGPPHEH